jgi:hypothetical protein
MEIGANLVVVVGGYAHGMCPVDEANQNGGRRWTERLEHRVACARRLGWSRVTAVRAVRVVNAPPPPEEGARLRLRGKTSSRSCSWAERNPEAASNFD